MLNRRLSTALGQQMALEFASAYLYLGMAAHFEHADLQGFARWMRVQAQEEAAHAMILFHFLVDRGGQPALAALDATPAAFGGPQEVFKKV
jgi:ferritin